MHACVFALRQLCALAACRSRSGQACKRHRARFEYQERMECVVQRYAAGGSDGGVAGAKKILKHSVFGRVERIGRSDRNGALPVAKVCRIRRRKVIGESESIQINLRGTEQNRRLRAKQLIVSLTHAPNSTHACGLCMHRILYSSTNNLLKLPNNR